MPEYTKETAADVIDIITEFGDKFKEKHGTRLCYASDEFYLKAERPLPDAEYYEGYVQLENGVGMCTSFKDEFMSGLYDMDDYAEERKLSLATGAAAYPLIKELCDEVTKKFPNIKLNVYKIENDFFGHTVNVAGLVTGKDLINQLKGKELYDKLIIPDVMLRSEGDLFLDNVSVEDVEDALGVELDVAFSADGYDLIDKIFNLS